MKWRHIMTAVLLCGIALSPLVTWAQDAMTGPGGNYRLQVGDTLEVKYRLTPEYNQTVVVLPDGDVSLTLLGDVHVAGSTVAEAHDEIVSKAALRLRNPDLSLSVKESARNHFSVIGEVTTPGRFELHGPITVVEALAVAGGFKTSGAQKNVTLVHRLSEQAEYGEAVRLDYTKLRRLNEATAMPTMRAGDVLIVTSSKTAKLERLIHLSNVGLYYPLP